jgi:predicted nucleotidyltransferase
LSVSAEEGGGKPGANRRADPGREHALGELRRRLSDLPGYVRAVLLFGSLARGEAGERSDVDLLVLHSGAPVRDPVERRRLLYKLVAERLEGAFEAVTLIDMDLERFLKPATVTPLLLNIYADALVVIDRVGSLEEFLQRVRKRIGELGLARVKNGRAYYWILPKPMEKVQLL